MAWTTPSTFTTGNVLSAANLNEQVRDNMTYVHAGKPATAIARNNGSSYSTTSTSFVDVDAANLSITLSLTTGRAMVLFTGTIYADAAAGRLISLDVDIDGTRHGGTGGLTKEDCDTNSESVGFHVLVTGLSVGSHTFKLQWKIATGTAYMFSDAGNKVHFAVLEW